MFFFKKTKISMYIVPENPSAAAHEVKDGVLLGRVFSFLSSSSDLQTPWGACVCPGSFLSCSPNLSRKGRRGRWHSLTTHPRAALGSSEHQPLPVRTPLSLKKAEPLETGQVCKENSTNILVVLSSYKTPVHRLLNCQFTVILMF